MIQTDARPYGALDMTQSLPLCNSSLTMSAIISPNFLHQHLQAVNALHVVGAPSSHSAIPRNNKDEPNNSFSFVDVNKTSLPPRTMDDNTEQSNAQVVSMGSASSLASDSDSYSASNDEPCIDSTATSLTSNRQDQFVTFSNEQLATKTNESSMVPDNIEERLALPETKNTGTVTRHEKINVNILSNDISIVPSIDDVSILLNEDPDRILKSHLEYEISYSFPVEVFNDETKIRKFRDGEITRVKKLLLQLYLSVDSSTESSNTGSYSKEEDLDIEKPIMKRNRSYSDFAIGASTRMAGSTRPRSATFHDTRKVNVTSEESSSKRRRLLSKYGQGEIEQWQNACLNAKNVYDASLPSLEEAACLFGYNSRRI